MWGKKNRVLFEPLPSPVCILVLESELHHFPGQVLNLEHQEMHDLNSKPSQSLLRLNSQILRLNQYWWETATTFFSGYSSGYISFVAL